MMSSLFIGATGLKSQSEGMGVVGNNLSNANTVGYKQMSIQFADLVSQYVMASSANLTNSNQKGLGAAPSTVRTNFEQGGLEDGSASTDLCIGGKGFFAVTNEGQTQYTRAGNFRFNKDGELMAPGGWNVMGRAIVNGVESDVTTGIKIDMGDNGSGFMPPKGTSAVTVYSRLGGIQNASPGTNNDFFALASSWDGTSQSPLKSGEYAYSEPFTFYDSEGALRTATIYYDKAGQSGGVNAVEYVIGYNPSEDGSASAETAAAGLLMAGTMTFSSGGDLINMTAFTPPSGGDPKDLSGWTPAAVQDGKPVFNIQPKDAEAQSIAFNAGISMDNYSGGMGSAAEAQTNPDAIYSKAPGAQFDKRASDYLGASPGAISTSSDGYAPGYLRDLEVMEDGTVRGKYSNNQTDDLYRITLYRFVSEDGLRHEGSNRYSATPESGVADEGVAGTENFGKLQSYALETSNVDYAKEFSQMIVTQRAFQMNSKVVTTSDTMLQKALEIKR